MRLSAATWPASSASSTCGSPLYPGFLLTVALAAAIYVNFFAHHFLPDIRIASLRGDLVALYWRTRIWFRIHDRHWWMPLPMAALLSAFALWVAENVGTATGTRIYSGQVTGQMVSFAKLGSWYLLSCRLRDGDAGQPPGAIGASAGAWADGKAGYGIVNARSQALDFVAGGKSAARGA